MDRRKEVVPAASGQRRFAAHAEAVIRHLEQLAERGQDVSPENVVGALELGLPRQERSRWANRVGPVYTTGQLQRLLRGARSRPITDEAVRDRRRSGRLVGFKTADGRWVWPAWQFGTANSRLLPHEDVIDLWQLLPWQSANALELVSWMIGSRRDLDGVSPVHHVLAHGVDERVRRAAARLRGRIAA